MTFYSPLRYPGSKKKLVNHFKEIIIKNNLQGGIYAEPYAGGASIALSLLIEGYVSRIIINDNDRSIYAFWHSILNRTEEFCELIEKTPINIETWELQKETQTRKKTADLFSLGFSTFFLNRTNRSGILTAGAIGGLNQNGKWKIDARYNREDLINRIKEIVKHKKNIRVYHLDAIKLVKKLKNKLPTKTLFYFDPPYFIKGKELYMNHYGQEDHVEIAEEIKKINGQKWVITYDSVRQIRELYKDYKPKKYYLRYSAGKSKIGEEIMINSKNMIMPKINSI